MWRSFVHLKDLADHLPLSLDVAGPPLIKVKIMLKSMLMIKMMIMLMMMLMIKMTTMLMMMNVETRYSAETR